MEIQNGIKQTLVMAAKPQYCATVSGEGYVDLLVWDEDDIITEAVVYISLINEFGDLHISDIQQFASLNLQGEEVQKEISELKTKVLDLVDNNGIYSTYLEEVQNELGRYEPTDWT